MTDLIFLAPSRLVLLALPVVLAIAYLVVQRRRRRYALRFTTLDLLDDVAPDRPGWRRHLPAVVMLAGTVVATLAVARPAVAQDLREPQRIVVLAVDVSRSMEATDVAPSRLDAEKAAATDFLANVPSGVAVGVVAFDSEARMLIQPTTNLAAVRRTIERVDLGTGTAIGEAVFLALDSIADAVDQLGGEDDRPGDAPPAGTVVLLSDGETTDGRSNEDASAAAKEQGIAVNTIAFGTDRGAIDDPLTGERVPVPVNEAALEELATATGGQSLRAETADELSAVYENLGRGLQVTVERREVTDWFAGLALVLMVAAATGSLLWFGRLP